MTRRLWIVASGLVALSIANLAWAERDKPAGKATNEATPVQVRWATEGAGGTAEFTRHVQPLLGKMGCNSRACHGSFQGQGGLRFSLFSSDPKMDHDALAKGTKEPRVDVKDPDGSLALLKATKQMDHKGGERFKQDSWQYRLFRSWIAAGASFEPGKGATLERLEIIPNKMVLPKTGEKVALKTVAHYSDSTMEDVTALTIFSTNDDVIAAVSESGQVTAGSHGDTAIVATFAGAVSTSHVIVPFPASNNKAISFTPNNKIDELAVAKWQKLGLQPSELCEDGEFLRRVSLDLIGTLPTSEEVRNFIDDKAPKKRSDKIDELLSRPEYGMFWATRYCDLTGNDDRFLPQPRPQNAWLWYGWFKDKLDKNVPYNEMVAGIVTATSREGRKVEEYVEEHKKVQEGLNKFDYATYAQRKTNDLFWKKTGNRGDQVALQISYAFLGIRLECASCHKHPFDRWTQDDFKGYTAFFTPVRVGVPKDVPKDVAPAGKPANNRVGVYSEVFVELAPPGRGAQVKGNKNKNNANALSGPKPRALGGSEYPLEEGKDPRVALMEWMQAEDNPFFASAVVNRMWHHYFGAGIVDPPDDLNASNPASNPELLSWVAKDFIAHKFDLKHLHRTILNSRLYQLSWKTNETNALDRRNFSHALLRRMPAEVVVDAIDQVTGSKAIFGRNLAPDGTRAIGLAPSRLNNQGPGYALAIFGRPLRTQTCDCERSMDAGLPQAMYLMNDTEVNSKISSSSGRLARQVKEISDNGKLVDELYLGTVCRYPTADEKQKALDYVTQASSRQVGFEDVLWTLLNLREFVFNH